MGRYPGGVSITYENCRLRERIAALEAREARLVAALEEIDNSPEPDHWVPEYQHCRDVASGALNEVKESTDEQ